MARVVVLFLYREKSGLSDTPSQEQQKRALALLRRLYHHLTHGGTTSPRDDERGGFKENIAREIERLEREIHD